MDDYNFSLSLLDKFFSQKKIQNSLKRFSEKNITGWEIWIQIEFAAFLSSNYGDQIEWYREHSLLPDGRKDKERIRMAADFVFRRKGYKLDCYNVLEFKQHLSPKTCLANMYKDVEKIDKVKSSSIDMRSFWVIGLHDKSRMSKSEIKSYILKNFDDVVEKYILTKYIYNTPYAYTIF